MIKYNTTPEPIIEFCQNENSPIFSNESNGAINIYVSKTSLVWRTKNIKINSKMYYNDEYYTLLFLPCIKNIVPCFVDIPSETDVISLRNIGLLPKLIKKGTLIGKAILIHSIQCHTLEIKNNVDFTE